MALINCPECGRENVSDSAENCPSCGFGVKKHFDTIKLQEQNAQKRQSDEQQSKLLNEERIKQKNLEKKHDHEFELKKQNYLIDNKELELKNLDSQWNKAVKKIIFSVLLIFLLPCIFVGISIGIDSITNGNSDSDSIVGFIFLLAFISFIIGITLTVFAIDNFSKVNNRYRLFKNDYQSYMGFETNKTEFDKALEYWCDTNYIILKKNSKFSKHTSINNKNGNIWISNKDIIFCPDEYYCGNPINISANAIYVKYENIQYYTKDGSIKYTNQVVNNGNNISLSGAIVGGIVAGGAGAIIGSRKDMNQLENITVKHDAVHTYVYYKDNDIIKVLDIEGNDFFQFIIKLMPEKEYYYLLNKQYDN